MMAALLSRSGKCPLCHYTTTTVKGVLSHIRAFHENEPNFCVVCGLDGCSTTSKTFSGLYSHVYRHHSNYIDKRGYYNSANCVQLSSNEVTEHLDCACSESHDVPCTDGDQGTCTILIIYIKLCVLHNLCA